MRTQKPLLVLVVLSLALLMLFLNKSSFAQSGFKGVQMTTTTKELILFDNSNGLVYYYDSFTGQLNRSQQIVELGQRLSITRAGKR